MENKDQSVTLFILTGKIFVFSVDEFLELTKTPTLYASIFFAILLDYVVKDFPLADAQGSILPFILWAISIFVTVLVYFGTLLFLCTIDLGPRIKFVFEPLVAFFAASMSTLFEGPLLVHVNMFTSLRFYLTLEAIITTFISTQIAMLLYVYLVRPGVIERLENRKPTSTAEPQAKLHIGGKPFSSARLRYIKSENQYIHVYTDFDDTLLLGAIKEVADQLDDQVGMIVHRSYYVMRRDVQRIEREGAQRTLVLSDDTRIPLARRRATAVEAWFNAV